MALTPRKSAWERKAAPEVRHADDRLRCPETLDIGAYLRGLTRRIHVTADRPSTPA